MGAKTDYVDAMLKGKQDLNHYVWTCARAFGTFISMRDEGLEAKIPLKYEQSLKDAEDHLEKLVSMPKKKRIAYIKAKQTANLKEYQKLLKKETEENKKLQSMLQKINDWNPPTDHVNLKNFMIQQVSSCISDLSYYKKEIERCNKTNYEEIFNIELKCVTSTLKYNRERLEEQEKNLAANNKWIDDLNNSVPCPDDMKA